MTVAEKFNNTGNNSPGVPRLGLPQITYWQEILHGLATNGGALQFNATGNYSYSTSFPHIVNLGYTFDDELMRTMGDALSQEGRAFANDGRCGLTFFSPNVNPARDPRWGRRLEVVSEDAFYSGNYAKAMVNGLQGGVTPKYKRVVATCKHVFGYDMENNAGNWRYQFDANITVRDIAEYYMTPFRACAEANVGAFMCSYNAVNGVPSCANSYIFDEVIRGHFNWTNEDQMVFSDCDAVQNVYSPHLYSPSRPAAAAAALKAGVDNNCGTYYQVHLPEAYAQGLLAESDVDTALVRAYSTLVRLGYFDDPAVQPLRQINWADVDTPETQLLAYQIAVKSMAMLKNDGTAPIDLKNKTVALIGSWANATTLLQGNYYGPAPFLISPLEAAMKVAGAVHYANGPSQGNPTTSQLPGALAAANKSDIIIYIDGLDPSVETEETDRNTLSWTGFQLDLIGNLAEFGKPMIVVRMGGGQLDDSPILNNPNISALFTAGYPGQSGGQAIIDVLTGVASPAGRLPETQYPSSYLNNVRMSDMTLRPSETNPGRTYRWYQGKPVLPFGYGLHYTNFTVSLGSNASDAASTDLARGGATYAISDLVKGCDQVQHTDLVTNTLLACPFTLLPLSVANTGKMMSDYVALQFVTGDYGPEPRPNKTLVAYGRATNITAGSTATLNLPPVTLGGLARVDENGNTILYPGNYSFLVDIEPRVMVNFTLTGAATTLDRWPTAPPNGHPSGVEFIPNDYFLGEFGSVRAAET
jgi:beta-D-xylosidase 4